MKKNLCIIILISTFLTYAQEKIEWDNKYQISIDDFKSNSTEIGGKIISLQSGGSIEFNYQMSSIQFMFTKNFNSKVSCVFNKNASVMIAPTNEIANKLVLFGQYQFDLSELFARKLRKKLFETKNISSSPNFYKVIYDEIQIEYVNRYSEATKKTELGLNEKITKELLMEVLKEIDDYADYCKLCKTKKK